MMNSMNWKRSLSNLKVFAVVIIDGLGGLVAVEAGRSGDEVGHVERHEPSVVETSRVALWQHESLANFPHFIDMT